MLNWTFLAPRNIVTIFLIVLAVRFVFSRAVNALDGHAAD